MSNHNYEFINRIKEEYPNAKKNPKALNNIVSDYLASEADTLPEKEQLFEKLAIEESDIEKKIYFYSVAISINHSIRILDKFLDLVWNNRENTNLDTLNFLYWQFAVDIFLYPELNSMNIKVKIWNILTFNVHRYESLFDDLLTPIPKSERDNGFVLVLTDQFLSFQHGPSKTAADRCKILIESLKKKVLLVNTAEMLSQVGRIPFFDASYGNYDEELINLEYIEWKSCKIPYFQCENVMPDIEVIRTLLSMVRRMRPIYVISIGTGGILDSLIANIIPTLSIGLMPSGLSITGIPFQTLSRPLNDDDKTLLKQINRTENSVITGTFGSSILQKTEHLTREDVGLPSDTWLAALVGGRLDYELSSDFWDMAEASSQFGLEYVILGTYTMLESVESAHPSLKGKIHNLGFVMNTLNYLDLCDIYLNPIRLGGGTSCVEALSLGIPVITTPYGDVGVNVGESFQAESYEAMISLIHRYITDFDFYTSQSLAAKKRSDELLNAENSFVKIIDEFSKRTF